MIPRKQASIHWRSQQDQHGYYRVIEVRAIDQEALNDGRLKDMRDLGSSMGACQAGWLDQKVAYLTPEGIFVELIRAGFFNDDAQLEALEQFAQVEGCEWAEEMRVALAARLTAERS